MVKGYVCSGIELVNCNNNVKNQTELDDIDDIGSEGS
jgi:hypothetical protein